VIAGMGFIVVSHSKDARRHADNPDVLQDHFFVIRFPLVLPENDAWQLFIGDEQDFKRMAPYNFTKNIALLMSGNTANQTGDCNYREKKEMRVACSIIYCRPEQKDCKGYSGRCTSVFPVPGNTEWLMKQKGRMWGRGFRLEQDRGRLLLRLERVNVIQTPWKIRKLCQKSCGTCLRMIVTIHT